MKNKSYKLFILSAALIILILGAAISGIYLANNSINKNNYMEKLEAAEKFIQEENYAAAITAYQEAIKLMPREEKAYQELATVYINQNNLSMAKYILSSGYRATHAYELRYLYADLLRNNNAYDVKNTTEAETEKSGQSGSKEKSREKETANTPQSEAFPLVEVPEEWSGEKYSGEILDAGNLSGINFAEMIFIHSDGTQTEVFSDADGSFEAGLKDGLYDLTISADGYVTQSYEMYVERGLADYEGDFHLSPELEEGQLRIVLEWGSAPKDLDLHLEGNLEDGTEVNLDFQKKEAYRGNMQIGNLDVDNRNGYGPETITLNYINGIFEVFVVDYTWTGKIGSSEARVTIYLRDQEPIVCDVPQGKGNIWKICSIDHGKVNMENMVENPESSKYRRSV